MNLEGQQLGEFEILERLGQGGMGAVYKARQVSLGRLVALKTLQASLADDAEYILRFQQEARAAAVLDHPNLVQVYSAGENEGLHWFAMQYIDGESARARLKRKGRVDPLEAIAIALHIAAALEYGWRKAGLIHRDIKPDNIFLSSDGAVKLGDLGLAKSAGQNVGLTTTGHSMGTPHYISPEQVQNMKDVDFRADIYSLGCTLYHLLSGQPPFDGNSTFAIMMKHVHGPVPLLQDAWPECPPTLSDAVGKMMATDPAQRPQNYAEVIRDLRLSYDIVSGESVPEPLLEQKPPTEQKPARSKVSPPIARQKPTPGKSSRTLWAVIGLGVIAVTIGAFFLFKSRLLHPATGESTTAAPGAATKDTPFMNTLGMKFVPVPGTKVLFGIWDTRVRDYQAYASARKVDDSWTKQQKDGVPAGREPDHPVVGVSWGDAQAFCQWLTEKETAEGRLPQGLKYRMPTDEEWSWAVGLPAESSATPAEKNWENTVDFPWGQDYPPRRKVGNYADETFHAKFPRPDPKDRIEGYIDGYATTSPVGSFPPNAYGLYDMGGNVWQWCEDWFDAFHRDRVLRGASWYHGDRGLLLSSYRLHYPPGARDFNYGFRCVLAPGSSAAPASTSPESATKDSPFANTLGMKFVPVPGTKVLFSVWDTRVADYAEYAVRNSAADSAWKKQTREGVTVSCHPDYPVVGVSWDDAQEFNRWLTTKELAEGRIPEGAKYRLPTDEEWSVAIGLPTEEGSTPAEKNGKNRVDFPWGKAWPPPANVGNYADETFHAQYPSRQKENEDRSKNQWIENDTDGYATTSPVGSFPANIFGLFDLGGNVWQWCEDWFDASQKHRVLRGASWVNSDRDDLLSSHRGHDAPGARIYSDGFRCVLELPAK